MVKNVKKSGTLDYYPKEFYSGPEGVRCNFNRNIGRLSRLIPNKTDTFNLNQWCVFTIDYDYLYEMRTFVQKNSPETDDLLFIKSYEFDSLQMYYDSVRNVQKMNSRLN